MLSYVPFDKDWTGFSAEEYREASESVMREKKQDTVEVMNRLDLSGYEVVRAQYFATLQNPAMTISNGKLRFNTACLKKFEDVEYVELLLNSVDRCIAIRPCEKDNPNAIRWGRLKEGRWCASIVCHGVPSKKVWDAYLHWQEQKNHSKISSVDFRNKKDFGWHDHVETLYFENGKSTSSRVFKELFYGHTVLRPSCYECPYKSVMHPGDMTIADYWGIEKAAPEFDDNKGISLVLVNNEAGEKAFEKVKEGLIWKQTKLEDSMQPPLKAPFPKPDNREQFWSDFENKSFEYVAKKYGGIGLKNDAKSLFRKIKRKIKKLVSKGGKRNTGTI